MPQSVWHCRLMRSREMNWLRTNQGIQSHFSTKWPRYKIVAEDFRNFYSTKPDVIYDELIREMEQYLKDYDFELGMTSFCNERGLNIDNVRNILARLLLTWPDLSDYPRDV